MPSTAFILFFLIILFYSLNLNMLTFVLFQVMNYPDAFKRISKARNFTAGCSLSTTCRQFLHYMFPQDFFHLSGPAPRI